MEVTYEIEYDQRVVDDDIPKIPKRNREIIKHAIETRLARDPMSYGKPLRYSFKGCRRLRVGDYRIIYVIQGSVVFIVKIGHRKEVYEG